MDCVTYPLADHQMSNLNREQTGKILSNLLADSLTSHVVQQLMLC